MRLAGALVVSLALAGCSVTVESHGSGKDSPPPAAARSTSGGLETWDLRSRPDRADVGLTGAEDTSAFETDDPRPIRVLLPRGRTLDLKASLVTFEGIGTPHGEPASMDASSGVISVDEAGDQYGRNLTQLGLSQESVQRWRERVERAGPQRGDANAQPFAEGESKRIGYVTVNVSAKYYPDDQTAFVKWTLEWSTGR